MDKLWWDAVNKVLCISLAGRKPVNLSPKTREEFRRLLKDLPGEVSVLVDCTQAEVDISLLQDLVKFNLEPNDLDLAQRKIRQVAVFGLRPIEEMKLKIILRVTDFNKKIQLFKSQGEAFHWLKEGVNYGNSSPHHRR